MGRDFEDSFRIDFTLKVLKTDDVTRHAVLALVPNPERYEWKERDGKRYLYDKLDKTLISEDVLHDMAKQLQGRPIFHQPQLMGDVGGYIRGRAPAIEARLQGGQAPPQFEDRSEEFLRSIVDHDLGFAILSLDIAGSTKLAASLSHDRYRALISTLLSEASEVIPFFRGHVLKYTGDGLIAYFAEPTFVAKNDLALHCALTLRQLVYGALNPAFSHCGFPQVDVRIGIDSGGASVVVIGSARTKQHADVIGKVVNLACKVQSRAEAGGIMVGDVALRNLHTTWRALCEEVPLPKRWPYKCGDGQPYKIHRVRVEEPGLLTVEADHLITS